MTDPQSFDSFAVAYDRFLALVDEPVWPWLSSAAVGVVPSGTGGRALDAGCGSGRTCVELAAHFDEVVGIDLSEPLIGLARGAASSCSSTVGPPPPVGSLPHTGGVRRPLPVGVP